MAPGKYELAAAVLKADGARIGRSSAASVNWPGRPETFKHVKALNNIVWELLNRKTGQVTGRKRFAFTQPKRRWVFVSARAEVGPKGGLQISLDAVPETRHIIAFEAGEKTTKETMRFLPAGEHTLVIEAEGAARIGEIVVRSIPELVYYRVPGDPLVKEFGPYMGEFLNEHILPNVNTLGGPREWPTPGAESRTLREWAQRGGKWLIHCRAPKGTTEKEEALREQDGTEPRAPKGTREKPITAGEAAEYIAQTPGFNLDFVHGSIADEFGDSLPYCAVYAEAVRKLKATPEFRDRSFYPFANNLYNGAEGREFARALVEADSAIAWKRYLKEQPDEKAAVSFLRTELVDRAYAYREHCPGSIEHLIVCFGYFSAPPEFLDTNPAADYKVYLDMQFNLIANDPAFWGTYGLMTYTSPFAHEEIVRWGAKLQRHYGIEGRTDRATKDPFELNHIENPDFTDGARGWQLRPAAENSIRAVMQKGFGWLQGRYPRTPEGNTALLTVRSAKAPNVFSQEIKNLQPGRCYSLSMITGDYKDMSKKERHAVTIKLENADLNSEKCFTHVYANCPPAHRYPPYDQEHKAWMNYHWRVFRAKGTTAKLTVSDWQSDHTPGGPAGQELMYNFVQVQPYFAPAAARPESKDGLVLEVMKNRFPVAAKGGVTTRQSVKELKEAGINVLFGYSGMSREAREMLRENGIVFFLILNVFHAPKPDSRFLAIDHRGISNVEDPINPDERRILVCPSHDGFRSTRIEQIVNEVKRLDPDGLSLDCIRFPVHWETISRTEKAARIRKFCFCEHCLTKFQREMHIAIPRDFKATHEKADWILKNHRRSWQKWRCGIITSMVRGIREAARKIKPDILITIHAVPWKQHDHGDGIKLVVGQDFKELARYVDVFSPMVYHHMLHEKPEWIHDVVVDMASLTQKPIWPCIQCVSGKGFWREEPLTVGEFKEAISQALRSPSQGINAISWGRMKKHKDRASAYRLLTRRE